MLRRELLSKYAIIYYLRFSTLLTISQFDSPYVKGLPIYVEVDEVNEQGEIQHRKMLSSYEDAYTAELQELYEVFANGKSIKSTLSDAKQDLEIFDMFYKSWASN